MSELYTVWWRVNHRFWGGQLPTPVLRWADLPDGTLGVTSRHRGRFAVRVGAAVTGYGGAGGYLLLYGVVLHEACHVAAWGLLRGHGRAFARECRRVAEQMGMPAPTREQLPGWPVSVCPGRYAGLPESAWTAV